MLSFWPSGRLLLQSCLQSAPQPQQPIIISRELRSCFVLGWLLLKLLSASSSYISNFSCFECNPSNLSLLLITANSVVVLGVLPARSSESCHRPRSPAGSLAAGILAAGRPAASMGLSRSAQCTAPPGHCSGTPYQCSGTPYQFQSLQG